MKINGYTKAAVTLVAIFLGGRAVNQFSMAQGQVAVASKPASATVDEIVRKRLEAASRGYDLAIVNLRAGRGNSGEVAEWVRRRAQAAVDLPGGAQRISILEECVKQMQLNVERAQGRVRDGGAPENEIPLAQFNALEVELWLAKARDAH